MDINARALTYAAERMQQVIDNAQNVRDIKVRVDIGNINEMPTIKYMIEEALIAPELKNREEKNDGTD